MIHFTTRHQLKFFSWIYEYLQSYFASTLCRHADTPLPLSTFYLNAALLLVCVVLLFLETSRRLLFGRGFSIQKQIMELCLRLRGEIKLVSGRDLGTAKGSGTPPLSLSALFFYFFFLTVAHLLCQVEKAACGTLCQSPIGARSRDFHIKGTCEGCCAVSTGKNTHAAILSLYRRLCFTMLFLCLLCVLSLPPFLCVFSVFLPQSPWSVCLPCEHFTPLSFKLFFLPLSHLERSIETYTVCTKK